MKPVAKIELSGLMASKAVRRIFDILQEDKKLPQTLFVGGCVRNALLKEPVSDIDLATIWTPQQVSGKLKAAGVKVVPTGIDHGTVTAVVDGLPIQITTLRRDIDTDGRHAKVSYTDDWLEDAKRRDFTMNTLLADNRGNIFDPLVRGLADLEKRKVIFVGDPVTRIEEDYLRILRFFRFHAWYGKSRPDDKALAACANAARNLKTLSKERVTQEILKILLSPRPEIFNLMFENKILLQLFDKKFNADYFSLVRKVSNEDGISATIGILILSGFSKSGSRRIEKQLRLSNKQIRSVNESIFYLKEFRGISGHGLKVLLYRAGHEIAELVLISRLLLDGASVAAGRKWISVLRGMERPVMPLRGQDLIDQGMKPGPAIKKALEKFERSWIRKDFKV
ncbi:MAG: CCA tRNA nucleotidyltransferase [Micavibrio aeruginosavorus]|uniref:CCA tRNA nucleotidyltransferase n=1 Tax=Micavibrio aeruginosavorus TaxID=349221 RepID=A0A2W5FQJ0_9BACT|nr:MAG: CCA tRNA nucleotidyltransferase [Micavibrio aeruginosavorus]